MAGILTEEEEGIQNEEGAAEAETTEAAGAEENASVQVQAPSAFFS